MLPPGGLQPAIARGRLRFEPYAAPAVGEAYADGRVYLRTEVGLTRRHRGGTGEDEATITEVSLFGLEYWLLVQLHAAVKYAEWAGAYGDVDVLAALVGPTTVIADKALPATAYRFSGDPKQRTDTEPVHTTSTLDAMASDPVQLVACARWLAADLLADFGQVETKLLAADGRILSARLDEQARRQVEAWMREVGLPVEP